MRVQCELVPEELPVHVGNGQSCEGIVHGGTCWVYGRNYDIYIYEIRIGCTGKAACSARAVGGIGKVSSV